MNSAEAEVLEWFPDGNWDDYWLGTPSRRNPGVNTNSFFDEDQGGWRSAEIVLREPVSEGPSDETLFLMRAPGKPEGGGVMGLATCCRRQRRTARELMVNCKFWEKRR